MEAPNFYPVLFSHAGCGVYGMLTMVREELEKRLQLDKSFYGESIVNSKRIRIEDAPVVVKFKAAPRIGVDYAGDYWKNTPWRFTI